VPTDPPLVTTATVAPGVATGTSVLP
jgi:hypothetical protein